MRKTRVNWNWNRMKIKLMRKKIIKEGLKISN